MIPPEREAIEARALGARVASGTLWTVGMRVSIRLIGIVSVVILARVLVPEDFGIVAQAAMFYSFVELVTALGLEAALIQSRVAGRDHYDTVWTLNVMRGLLNAAVLALIAYPAAVFLREPRLDSVICFYAMASFVQGFANVGTVDFRKRFDFNRDFLFALWSKLAGFVVSIAVALVWRTYWAFVAGVLAGAATTVLASYLMSDYRPRFSLSMWRPLLHFSKWMLGHDLFNTLASRLDVLLLSRFSSVESVGVYSVSYEVAGTPTTEIAMPVARALMPGLSRVGEDREAFRSLYLSTLGLVLLAAVPAGIGVSALAGRITDVLLGASWATAVPLIQVLALFGVVRAVFPVSASAYLSFGRVDLLAKISLAGVLLNGIAVAAGVHLAGALGVAWGLLAASCCRLVLTLGVQMRVGMLDATALLRRCWKVLAAGTGMGAALSAWQLPAASALAPAAALLVLEILLGAAVFGAIIVALWPLTPGVHGPERALLDYLKTRLARSA